MQTAQPRRNAWPGYRLPGAIGPTGAVPIAIPAVVKTLAVVKIAPFDHINIQPVIPVSGGMWRRRITRMAALSSRALRRRRRTDRRWNGNGFAGFRQPRDGLRNRRLRLV